jgi:hypothetical protein
LPDPVTQAQRYPGGSERTKRLFQGLENQMPPSDLLSPLIDLATAAAPKESVRAVDSRDASGTNLATPGGASDGK